MRRGHAPTIRDSFSRAGVRPRPALISRLLPRRLLAVVRAAAVPLALAAVSSLTPTAALAQAPSGWTPKVEPFSDGLLFRIARQGTPDSYAFATPLVADPRIRDVPPEALDALKRARTFARTAPFDALGETRSFALAQMKDGNTLRALLGAETFQRLLPRLAERGIDERSALHMKPWAAGLALVLPRGETEPVEQALARAATQARLKTIVVELAQDQARAIDALPREVQVTLLAHAIDHRAAYAELLPAAGDAWIARSLGGIHDAVDRFPRRFPDVSPEYRRVARSLVNNRVVQIKHRLTLPLRQGRVFIAAGPLLLHGSQGLLSALERDGYRIEKMW
jgi:uncharacterized protein YbaP (TraB family)